MERGRAILYGCKKNHLQIYGRVVEIFVAGVGNCVDGNPLRPVKCDTDEHLSAGTKTNGAYMSPATTRAGPTRMMNDHAKDAQQWIMNRLGWKMGTGSCFKDRNPEVDQGPTVRDGQATVPRPSNLGETGIEVITGHPIGAIMMGKRGR